MLDILSLEIFSTKRWPNISVNYSNSVNSYYGLRNSFVTISESDSHIDLIVNN